MDFNKLSALREPSLGVLDSILWGLNVFMYTHVDYRPTFQYIRSGYNTPVYTIRLYHDSSLVPVKAKLPAHVSVTNCINEAPIHKMNVFL